MYALSKRQIEFVRLMLEEEDYRSILYFSKQLRVSDKTLKQDLKGIRVYLSAYGIQVYGKTGKGILIDQGAKNNINILNDLHAEPSELLHESAQARRIHILKNMLIRSDINTSIQKLSEQYYVSKASIVNDIKYLEQWLNKFNLTLEKTSEGTKIKGDETNIRKALAYLIQKYQEECFDDNPLPDCDGAIRLNSRTRNGLLELFRLEDIIFIESLLEKMEKESNIRMGDIYYVNLLTHILICIKRVKEGIFIEDNKIGMIRTDTLKHYCQAQKITKIIKNKYQIDLGNEETYYIYQYLISSGLEEISAKTEENDESLRLSMDLTKYVSDIAGADFQTDKELLNGLLLHIRPMLNRLKYNIQLRNPLLEEICERYPQMLGICQISLAFLSRKYQLKEISIDEIAHIATYYQTMTVRLTTPQKVLVVCHSGYGTSQLLAAKLKREFSSIDVVDVVSSRRVETMDLSKIEFIISTVPINVKKIPYIVISALLTEKDVQDIKNSMQVDENQACRNESLCCLHQHLKKSMIHINEELDTNKILEGTIIVETRLMPKLNVQIREPSMEKMEMCIFIDNEKAGKEEVTVILAIQEEKLLKSILADLYKISVQKNGLELLAKCSSMKEVQEFLSERAL